MFFAGRNVFQEQFADLHRNVPDHGIAVCDPDGRKNIRYFCAVKIDPAVCPRRLFVRIICDFLLGEYKKDFVFLNFKRFRITDIISASGKDVMH